jgi:hypothetical protein
MTTADFAILSLVLCAATIITIALGAAPAQTRLKSQLPLPRRPRNPAWLAFEVVPGFVEVRWRSPA